MKSYMIVSIFSCIVSDSDEFIILHIVIQEESHHK